MPDETQEPLLTFTRDTRWVNKHQNLQVQVERLYDVWNRWSDGRRPERSPWRAGLLALQQVVREAESQQKQVRALGGGWSFSGAVLTRDFLVNTRPLNYLEVGLRPESCDPSFAGAPERLVFTQCGTSVLELNQALEAQGLALPTSGASNGQTLAGACSTGTHGSAHTVGSMQDFVLGLHLVTQGGEHLWLERASRPVVSPRFAQVLGTRLVRDDRLFLAALVGFGSFGLLHALLFEAEPLYLLERHVRRYDYGAVRPVLDSLDVSPLGLPEGAQLPFHFEVVLNPYALGEGQQGAWVRFMYKRPFQPSPAAPRPLVATVPSEDVLGIIGALGDLAPALYPMALEELLERTLRPESGTLGTPGQIFGTTDIRGAALSTELGVALGDVERTMDAMATTLAQFPFGATVALRYVRASPALLALTRFSPVTCTLELPAVGTPRSAEAFRRIWAELDARGITYTLHWGQVLPDTSTWLRRAFGLRLEDWIAARRELLGPTGRRTFANELLERYGLAD
jgi:hypothetical protein